jgi:DNA-binding CsgD family transcriptional regulator
MPDALSRTSLYGFDFREPDLRRSEDRKTYDIKSLWQRSHEIVALAVRGLKQTEIAEILEITPQTVSNTLNSELGKQKLAVMRRGRDEEALKVSERIEYLTQKALDVYEKIFENKDGAAPIKLQKETADTVALDLSGYRAPTKIQSFHATATLEEIEEFKKRGIQAQREAGMIVEVPDERRSQAEAEAEAEIIESEVSENDSLDQARS